MRPKFLWWEKPPWKAVVHTGSIYPPLEKRALTPGAPSRKNGGIFHFPRNFSGGHNLLNPNAHTAFGRKTSHSKKRRRVCFVPKSPGGETRISLEKYTSAGGRETPGETHTIGAGWNTLFLLIHTRDGRYFSSRGEKDPRESFIGGWT